MAVNPQDVKDAVKQFILDEVLTEEAPESFDESMQLMESGVLNSLAALQLVTFLEDTFGITIEPREVGIDHMNTLDDITALVISKQ